MPGRRPNKRTNRKQHLTQTRNIGTKPRAVGGRGSGRADAKSDDRAPSDGNALLADLTPREREVLALYLKLLNPKAVANRLGTRLQTVRNQLASIERKLGVHSTEELIKKLLSAAVAVPPQEHG